MSHAIIFKPTTGREQIVGVYDQLSEAHVVARHYADEYCRHISGFMQHSVIVVSKTRIQVTLPTTGEVVADININK